MKISGEVLCRHGWKIGMYDSLFAKVFFYDRCGVINGFWMIDSCTMTTLIL